MPLLMWLRILAGFTGMNLLGGWLLTKWFERDGDPMHAKPEDGKNAKNSD